MDVRKTLMHLGKSVEISLDDLLWEFKVSCAPDSAQAVLLRRHLAASDARRRGICLCEEECNAAWNAFWSERDLMEKEQIEEWMSERQLDEQRVVQQLEAELLQGKVEAQVVADEQVRTWYEARKYDYQRALLDRMDFARKGVAAEIMLSLREEECTWETAAKHSLQCGRFSLARSDLGREVAGEVFGAEPGDLVGPCDMQNGNHAVCRVIAFQGDQLDEETVQRIQMELLSEYYGQLQMNNPARFLY